MLSATAQVDRGTLPLFLSGIFLLQEWKWEVIVTNGPPSQLWMYALERKIPASGWLPTEEALTSHNILTPYWDERSQSAQLPSLHSPYWLFSWPKFVNVFLSSNRTWTLYMSWHQDTSCGCCFPCEVDPRSHLQFCYIPLMLDWIGIWGVSRSGMTVWALCPVPQMVFVTWWGKLPCQAGFVWLL